MNDVTLVMTEAMSRELLVASRDELESAGVVLAQAVVAGNGSIRLLATEIQWCSENSYLERHRTGLKIASDGYVPALSDAEQSGSVAIWMHTHPGKGSSPRASRYDTLVDEQLVDLFQLRTNSAYYASIVISSDAGVL
jgi:proteasome lid subunit RPN8/RPN11